MMLNLLNIYKEAKKSFYNDKDNLNQKSRHWKIYDFREFNTDNLKNFRSSGKLSEGLDDKKENFSFKIFAQIINDLGEEYVLPKCCNKSLIKFFKDVFPALPVIDIILALLCSRLSLAKLFKKKIVSLILIIFLFFLLLLVEITHPAPFFSASLTYLFPSLFFPFIAKNKLSFFIVLVSIESPLKLTKFFFFIIFFNINLFCKIFKVLLDKILCLKLIFLIIFFF